MATPAEWARGYARQAQADFRAWQALEVDEHVHPCHRMLFLQMACEKLCKARLIDAGTPPTALQNRWQEKPQAWLERLSVVLQLGRMLRGR